MSVGCGRAPKLDVAVDNGCIYIEYLCLGSSLWLSPVPASPGRMESAFWTHANWKESLRILRQVGSQLEIRQVGSQLEFRVVIPWISVFSFSNHLTYQDSLDLFFSIINSLLSFSYKLWVQIEVVLCGSFFVKWICYFPLVRAGICWNSTSNKATVRALETATHGNLHLCLWSSYLISREIKHGHKNLTLKVGHVKMAQRGRQSWTLQVPQAPPSSYLWCLPEWSHPGISSWDWGCREGQGMREGEKEVKEETGRKRERSICSEF